MWLRIKLTLNSSIQIILGFISIYLFKILTAGELYTGQLSSYHPDRFLKVSRHRGAVEIFYFIFWFLFKDRLKFRPPNKEKCANGTTEWHERVLNPYLVDHAYHQSRHSSTRPLDHLLISPLLIDGHYTAKVSYFFIEKV